MCCWHCLFSACRACAGSTSSSENLCQTYETFDTLVHGTRDAVTYTRKTNADFHSQDGLRMELRVLQAPLHTQSEAGLREIRADAVEVTSVTTANGG